MAGVQVGCILRPLQPMDGSQHRDLIERVDDAGLDHLAIGDHVGFFNGSGADGLLAAAGILTVSARLSVNTGVFLLPLRHPVVVARQLADLASLAPGRFVFGVGVGGEDRNEVQNCGVDPATRGARMDEAIHIVRALLSGRPLDFDGVHFSLQQAQITPPPLEPIPIVVGGRSDAAIRRAGRLGDGWFGIWVSPSRYAASLDTMKLAAADSGRAEPAWVNALNVWIGVDDDAESARAHVAPAMESFYGMPFDRFARWSPTGSPQTIADFLVPYVEAGCNVFNLIMNGRSVEHEIEAAAEIRQLVGAAH